MKPVLMAPTRAATTEAAAATQWTQSTRGDSRPTRTGKLSSALRTKGMDNMSNSQELLSEPVDEQKIQVSLSSSCWNARTYREEKFRNTVDFNWWSIKINLKKLYLISFVISAYNFSL